MVAEDRQRVIETNRSLRVIKNELESLLEKGVITDSAFDSIHSLLPTESPLSGGGAAAAVGGTRSTNAASAPSPAPTPTNNNNNPTSPPSYAQTTATPPSLPQRNPAPPPDKPVLVHARALYRYAAADARDCSFERDDRLAVHEYMNADWWMGRNLRTGQEGIFPRNYVMVEEAEQQKAAVAPVPAPAPMGYHQPQYAAPQQQHYPVSPVPVGGYPAPPPPGQAVAPYQPQHQQQHDSGSKMGEHGKKFGKKLGNAAIFGAGATLGSKVVNSIF